MHAAHSRFYENALYNFTFTLPEVTLPKVRVVQYTHLCKMFSVKYLLRVTVFQC